MVHSYLIIPHCMSSDTGRSTLTLCSVITLIYYLIALTMQFQLMLQAVLINKWMLYYNVVKVSDMNTYPANDFLSYTHSDNTRCPRYSTNILSVNSYGYNQMRVFWNCSTRSLC